MIVVFDQLKVNPDGSKLIVSAHVKDLSDYADVYLDNISVMTADKVSETNPYNPTSDVIYSKSFTEDTKSVYLEISAEDCIREWETEVSSMNFTQEDMLKTMFFVYIKIKVKNGGAIPATVPCGEDSEYTLGVTFCTHRIYEKVLNYTKELAQECAIPREFTDFILLWNALKAAIETGHYVPAIKFFNLLFGNIDTKSVTKNCCCHG